MVLALSFGFVACSDDDDDDGASYVCSSSNNDGENYEIEISLAGNGKFTITYTYTDDSDNDDSGDNDDSSSSYTLCTGTFVISLSMGGRFAGTSTTGTISTVSAGIACNSDDYSTQVKWGESSDGNEWKYSDNTITFTFDDDGTKLTISSAFISSMNLPNSYTRSN